MDRKALIVLAATQSFSQFGYKATTMDLVAKMANVGKGTIYTYFKNKEELLEVIVENLILDMKRVVMKEVSPIVPFSENAHRVLYCFLDFQKEHELTIKLLQEIREIGTPEVEVVMKRLGEVVTDYLSSQLQQAIDKGELVECNTKLTAFLMYSQYKSLVFDWEKHNSPLSEEEIATCFEQYFFKGLLR